jgi:hypothetical protein
MSGPRNPALAPFVSSIGYAESRFEHARELALPSGTVQLLVNLDRDEMRTFPLDGGSALTTGGATVQGPYVEPVLIDPADQRRIMWVSFRVGGSHPFVPTDAAELRGRAVDLVDLWGRDGAVLRERLLCAPGVEARLLMLEDMLLARAGRCTAASPSPPRPTGSAGRRSGSAGRSPHRSG